MTKAEKIAVLFQDGGRWELEDGTRLEDVLDDATPEQHGSITIHRFDDGSAIVTAEEGWWDTLEGAIKAGLVLEERHAHD